MAGKVQPVQRQWAHFDSVARQRQASKIRELEERIEAAERSASAVLLNPGGVQVHGYMASQAAQRVAELREVLTTLESLTGDELVMHVCANEIAQAEQPDWVELVNPDGSPLARGGYMAAGPPGYPR